jgi:hypothetical protein
MAIVFRNAKGTKLTIADMDGNFSHLVAVDAAETSRATAAENTLTSNLNSEISTRATADATLTNNLNSEISTARAAESTNAGNITAEINRATAAETANATAITNEASTARAAETTLTNNLNAEIIRATAAEDSNASDIAAEIARATAAETVNAAAINALPDSAQVLGLIDSNHVALKAIGLDYGVLANKPTIPVSGTDFVDSAFVTAQIDALIDGAPGTLNTLNEIAAALNDDDSAYNTLIGLIAAKTDFDSANATTIINSTLQNLNQNIVPDTNNTYDLGTSSNRFKDLYLSGSTLHIGSIKITESSGSVVFKDSDNNPIGVSTIDSAYVQLRQTSQDFAYSSLTGAPTFISTFNNDLGYLTSALDSAEAIALIDSDFVLSKTGTILDSSLTTQLIDSALPIGQLGQQYFVSTNNTNKLETDYLLTVNDKYVETAAELAEEIADVTTLQEVFNTWNRFSHSGSSGYPANASEMNAWVYNSGPGTISQPLNTGTATGFYSVDTYENYTHTARFTSGQTDNDIGFMVIGFVAEGTGASYKQHTLSAVRQTDGAISGIASWDLVYNIGQSDQAILTAATNGGSGPANAATSTGGWNTYTDGTLIFTQKTGRNITIRTSYYSSTNLALNPATDMDFDLLSDSRTVRFAGPVPYGYGAWSQGDMTISEISFIPGQSELLYHFGGTLSGNTGGDVYTYSSDSSAWNLDSDLTLQGAQGKILHNNKTGRTYYVDGTQAHSIGSVRQFNDVMYLLPQNSEPDSADTGGLGLRAGMFATADQINWDPASKGSGGAYPVFFNGTSWVALY